MAATRHSRRLTRLAGWTALTGALIACGLGLKMTQHQFESVSAVLLDIERRSAENVRPELERQLRLEEERLLRAVEEQLARPELWADIVNAEPLAAVPFAFLADGTLVTPLLGGATADAAALETAPEVEQALRIFWSAAAPEEKARALDAVYGRETLDLRSRVRARALSLGLQSRHGAAAAAAAGYEELFGHLPPGGEGLGPPSWLQLVTARSECLLLAGEAVGASAVAATALATLQAAGNGAVRPATSLAEERVFLRRAAEAFARAGSAPPAAFRELEARHRERDVALGVLQSLRETMSTVLSHPEDGRRDDPRYFHEERVTAAGKRPYLAVWELLSAEEARGTACGFLVDLDHLESTVTAALAAAAPGSRIAVRAVPRAHADDFVDLTGLSDERAFVRLGLERHAWEERLDGARRPFAIAGVLIVALACALILGFAVFFRGVRAEMELSRLKTELVAGVSHELKTPLALIRLFGETLLLDRVSDPEQKKRYYQIITRESERLSHLITNVLSFASIEAGKKSYELRPTDLTQVVRQVFDSYRAHLTEKGFSHRLESPESLLPIAADPDAVSQAIINLLENAVKYSKDRKEVVVRVEETAGSVRVGVADQGIGIAPADQPRVFEDYYRTREARALGTRGSGLGLSLVQHILRAHGGTVELTSEPGRGSVFTLVFPHGQGPERAEES